MGGALLAALALAPVAAAPARAQPAGPPREPPDVHVVRVACDPSTPPDVDPALDRSLRVELASAGFRVVELVLRAADTPGRPVRGFRLRFEPVCAGAEEDPVAWWIRTTSPHGSAELRVPVRDVPPVGRARLLAVTAAEALRAVGATAPDRDLALGAEPSPDLAPVVDEGAGTEADAAPVDAGAAPDTDADRVAAATPGEASVVAAAPAASPKVPPATASPPNHWRVRARLSALLSMEFGGVVSGAGAYGALQVERRIDRLLLGVDVWPAGLAGGDLGLVGALGATFYVGATVGPAAFAIGLGGVSTAAQTGAFFGTGPRIQAPVAFQADPRFRVGNERVGFELHVPFTVAAEGAAIASLRHTLYFPLLDGVSGGLRGDVGFTGLSELAAFFLARVVGDGGPGTLRLGASVSYAWLEDRVRCNVTDDTGVCVGGDEAGLAVDGVREYRGPAVGLELEWLP